MPALSRPAGNFPAAAGGRSAGGLTPAGRPPPYPPVPPARPLAALALALVLTGCVSPRDASAPAGRADAARAAWVERRAAQLSTAGLAGHEAAAKASAEWSSLTGDEREALILRWDGKAEARAEQRKVEQGLDDLRRGR